MSNVAIVLYGGTLLAAFSVISGAFAPKRVRLPLILAGILACSFWLILPSGFGVL